MPRRERAPWSDLDAYAPKGGCWCDDRRTVAQLRAMGHDERCTQARHAWESNYRHLRALERD